MPKRPRVVNLMQALQKSLGERRPLARAAGHQRAARRRSRPARRKAA
jgi:hypothetical protein